jgi:hypothetical protein
MRLPRLSRLARVAFIVFASGFALPGLAGAGSGLAAIEHVGNFNGADLVFFYTTSHAAQPSCNTYRKRWVLSLSTQLGRSQYAYLMSAIVAGREVVIGGTGTCDLYADSETVAWFGQPISYTGSGSDIPSF